MCPYADPPRTVEGQTVVEAAGACLGQVGISRLGAGIDPVSVLSLARAMGCAERPVAFLLPYAQAGVALALVEVMRDGG